MAPRERPILLNHNMDSCGNSGIHPTELDRGRSRDLLRMVIRGKYIHSTRENQSLTNHSWRNWRHRIPCHQIPGTLSARTRRGERKTCTRSPTTRRRLTTGSHRRRLFYTISVLLTSSAAICVPTDSSKTRTVKHVTPPTKMEHPTTTSHLALTGLSNRPYSPH